MGDTPPIRMTMATRAVLGTLLTNPGIHGYEITKRAGLSAGSAYPILANLEARGLARSWWADAPPGRRPLRCYALTEAGEALARRPR